MKNFKKVASIVLALVMALAMTSIAFAVENGDITINNAEVGHTYTIYRILNLDRYNEEAGATSTGAYFYTVASGWADFVKSQEIQGVYLNTDESSGYVTWNFDEDEDDALTAEKAAAFAKLALAYAKANNLQNQGSTIATDTTVTFSELAYGYYLVDSTLGTICSLNTTTPHAAIQEKNEEPTNEKEVQEDSNETWGKVDDACIGQVVEFHSTITAKEGAENYILHDKMTAGLTFNNDVTVTLTTIVDGEEVTNAVATDNYTVNLNANHTSGTDTFDVVFTQGFCDTLKDGDKIIVSYSAVLNGDAEIADNANINETRLSYGENSRFETTPSQTETYTWEFKVFKYTTEDDGATKKGLANAKFSLYKDEGCTNIINLVKPDADAETYVVCDGECVKAGHSADDHITEIVTTNDGRFTIVGLDSDTYYLKETKAPNGYNALLDPIKVVIDSEGSVTFADEDTADIDKTVEVLNNAGSQLPSTGGIGTTIFYIVGSLLVVAAAILLITKKRMATAQ